MKSEAEIKERLLSLYTARESFLEAAKPAFGKSIEEVRMAARVVESVYNEKIEALNWVLDLDKKVCIHCEKEILPSKDDYITIHCAEDSDLEFMHARCIPEAAKNTFPNNPG